MDIIKNAIETGKNVVIAGATSVGKTTDIDTKVFPVAGRVLEAEYVAAFRLTDAEIASIFVKPE